MVFRPFLREKRNFEVIIILLLQFWAGWSFGQTKLQDTIFVRLERANKISQINPTIGLQLLNQNLKLAKKEKYLYEQCITLENIGLIHLNANRMEKAVTAFQQSMKIAIEMDSVLLEGKVLHRLGNLYMRIGRLEKAKETQNTAYSIFKKEKNLYWQASALGNLGNIYTQLGGGEEALKQYQMARDLFEQLGNEEEKRGMNLNIGYYYLMQGQGEMALPFVKNNLAYSLQNNLPKEIAMGYGNLGYSYFLIDDFDQAFRNYQICVDTAQKYGFVRIEYDTYKDMSATFKKQGNSSQAMEYLTKYYTLKDSIIGESTQAKISELEIQFQAAKQEREIQVLEQKQRIQGLKLWFLFISLGLLIVIGLLTFQKMKGDLRKKQDLLAKNKAIHQLEKTLIEKELEKQLLEKQKATDELAYKSKYLTDFALEISQKNEFSATLFAKLAQIERLRMSKVVSNKFKELHFFVTSQLQINEGVAVFQQHIDEINLGFNYKLQQQFPDLTAKDLILCGLLRLNLQNKEIATIRGVSDNAVKMARYRLRKKLSLSGEDDIVAFLKAF